METLEKLLYQVPEPPKRIRDKPMQVLALGMSRSGTESLSRALRILGYNHVQHGFELFSSRPMLCKAWTLLARRKWGRGHSTKPGDSNIERSDFDKLLGHCEAVTDQPTAFFGRELIRAYPDAKVILNYREVDPWYQSLSNITEPEGFSVAKILPWFNAELYWKDRYIKECHQAFFRGSVIQHGKWIYEEHNATIRGLVPPEKMLEWTTADGWEPLCKFLGKEIPSEEFPSGNTPSETLHRVHEYMEKALATARRNMVIFLVLLAVLTAYAVAFRHA